MSRRSAIPVPLSCRRCTPGCCRRRRPEAWPATTASQAPLGRRLWRRGSVVGCSGSHFRPDRDCFGHANTYLEEEKNQILKLDYSILCKIWTDYCYKQQYKYSKTCKNGNCLKRKNYMVQAEEMPYNCTAKTKICWKHFFSPSIPNDSVFTSFTVLLRKPPILNNKPTEKS